MGAARLVGLEERHGAEVQLDDPGRHVDGRVEDLRGLGLAIELLDGAVEELLLVALGLHPEEEALRLDGADELAGQPDEKVLVGLVERLVVEPIGDQHPADVPSAAVGQRSSDQRPRAGAVIVVGGRPEIAVQPNGCPAGDDASEHPFAGRQWPARDVIAARPAVAKVEERVVSGEEEQGAGVAAKRHLGHLERAVHGRLDLDRSRAAALQRSVLVPDGTAVSPSRGQQP